MDDLQTYRRTIDKIDQALICLLAQRFGAFETAHALPAIDPWREKSQMSQYDDLSRKLQLRPELAQAIFRLIIDEVVNEHRRGPPSGR